MPKISGSLTNGVLLVGEALGEQEAEVGQPFIGKAGGWLTSIFKRHGMEREEFGIDNSLRCRPPDNKIHLAIANGALNICPSMPGHLDASLGDPRVKVIVPMGAVAMASVLGMPFNTPQKPYLGYPTWSRRWNKWVVPTWHPSFLFRGNQRFSGCFASHVKKATQIASGDVVPRDYPDCLVDPHGSAVQAWINQWHAAGCPPLAFDIETPYKASVDGQDEGVLVMDDPSYTILRIGFAYEGGQPLSLAWRADYMGYIRNLLDNMQAGIVWNGRYDVPRLAANGFEIHKPVWDAMWLWHLLNSDLDKGLAFVTPLLLPDAMRWKHLGDSDPGRYNAIDAHVTARLMTILKQDANKRGQWDSFQRHIVELDSILNKLNVKGIQIDQDRRRELSQQLSAALVAEGEALDKLVPTEAKALHPKEGFKKQPDDTTGLVELPPVPVEISYCPLCGEVKPKAGHFKTYKKKHNPCAGGSADTRIIPTSRWARPLPFVPSNIRLQAYLAHRGHAAITKRDKVDGRLKVTFDDDALKALSLANPKDKVYPKVQDYRKVEKQLGFVGEWNPLIGKFDGGMPQDLKGRVHAVLGHTPSTLRLSCVNPNLQQIPADKKKGKKWDVRSVFVPDPGFKLFEVDYSAIEARLVAYFMPSPDYDRLARLGVHDFLNGHMLSVEGKITDKDVPTLALSDSDLKLAFKALKAKFPEEREVAKRVVHGTSYGMGSSELFRKYPEVFLTPKRARDLRSLFYDVCPDIPRWQEATVTRAEEEAELRNPFGYAHKFWRVCEYKMGPDGEWMRKWGDDAKASIAFLPQSTAAGIIKEAMLCLEEEYALASKGWLLLQVHDSLLFQLPEAEFDRWAEIIINVMCRQVKELPLPWTSTGECLRIGVEAKAGKRWGSSMVEWR